MRSFNVGNVAVGIFLLASLTVPVGGATSR